MDTLDPNAALLSIADTRRTLAGHLVTPSWYHPVLGAAAGCWLASAASHSWPIVLAAEAGYLLVAVWLMRSYRRVNGVWISGAHPGRTRRASAAMAAGVAGLAGLAAAGDFGLGQRWSWVLAGVLAVPFVVLVGNWWDRLLQDELAGQR